GRHRVVLRRSGPAPRRARGKAGPGAGHAGRRARAPTPRLPALVAGRLVPARVRGREPALPARGPGARPLGRGATAAVLLPGAGALARRVAPAGAALLPDGEVPP